MCDFRNAHRLSGENLFDLIVEHVTQRIKSQDNYVFENRASIEVLLNAALGILAEMLNAGSKNSLKDTSLTNKLANLWSTVIACDSNTWNTIIGNVVSSSTVWDDANSSKLMKSTILFSIGSNVLQDISAGRISSISVLPSSGSELLRNVIDIFMQHNLQQSYYSTNDYESSMRYIVGACIDYSIRITPQ